jgi:hypothetical protein
MTHSTRWQILFLAFFLLAQGCSRGGESESGEAKSKVKEAVKEVVTQDFKSYEGAKQSLKEIDEKSRAQREMIDQELKAESK